MNYLELLEHSFEVEKGHGECAPDDRLVFLSRSIFDFTTYDSAMDQLFAAKAVEVCRAVSERKTFEYINDAENYRWYLLMCNMPFFARRLNWGGSIRGAWWDTSTPNETGLDSCGLWQDGEQISAPLKFSTEQWQEFIAAVIEFAIREAGK